MRDFRFQEVFPFKSLLMGTGSLIPIARYLLRMQPDSLATFEEKSRKVI